MCVFRFHFWIILTSIENPSVERIGNFMLNINGPIRTLQYGGFNTSYNSVGWRWSNRPVLFGDNVLFPADIASVAFLSTAMANPFFFLLSKAHHSSLLLFLCCFGLLSVLLLNLVVFCINLGAMTNLGPCRKKLSNR